MLHISQHRCHRHFIGGSNINQPQALQLLNISHLNLKRIILHLLNTFHYSLLEQR